MRESRRAFLAAAFTAAAASAVSALPAAAQMQQPPPQDPRVPPAPPDSRLDPYPQLLAGRDPKFVLKANQAGIKKNVAKLSQLVSDLQKGLDDNDTTEVLSLDVIHKTEEIEKLAKQIRELVRSY